MLCDIISKNKTQNNGNGSTQALSDLLQSPKAVTKSKLITSSSPSIQISSYSRLVLQFLIEEVANAAATPRRVF